jgi:hypothetical protein
MARALPLDSARIVIWNNAAKMHRRRKSHLPHHQFRRGGKAAMRENAGGKNRGSADPVVGISPFRFRAMTTRKADNLLRGDRTPAYVDRETGAGELLISPDTWDQWVKEGRLPPPFDTFPASTPRWRWADGDRKLSGRTVEASSADDTAAYVERAHFIGKRKVQIDVQLPEGVEVSVRKKKNGKVYTYYYWNPHRGTKREQDRLKLPDPTKDLVGFNREIERLQRSDPAVCPPGSIGDLVSRYRGSEEFKKNSEGTKTNYEVHMRRFEDPEGWGMLPAKGLEPIALQTLRDAMKDTPVMANQMLSVGGTIWDWGIPLGIVKTNPFEKIKDIEIPDRGHVPWPAWVVDYVRNHAPPDLVRMTRLGVMTCQRVSDMVRMGPSHRDGANGVWCRPKKTRKRRRAFLIPLATVDVLELDRWAETPIKFTNSRRKTPIDRFRDDLYIYSPKAGPYTPDSLRARLGRWFEDPEEGRVICRRWKEWVTAQVKKYEWDIDPEDADHPTIHGLGGTGILARAEQGYDVDQIANDIGMTRQNVAHYMRFRDQMKVAADGRKRLQIVGKED